MRARTHPDARLHSVEGGDEHVDADDGHGDAERLDRVVEPRIAPDERDDESWRKRSRKGDDERRDEHDGGRGDDELATPVP